MGKLHKCQSRARKRIWHSPVDERQAGKYRSEHRDCSERTYTNVRLRAGFLGTWGEIIEVDDTFLNPDDILGNGTRKLPFDEIGEQIISVGFTSENQEVVARYLIDRVNVVEVA